MSTAQWLACKEMTRMLATRGYSFYIIQCGIKSNMMETPNFRDEFVSVDSIRIQRSLSLGPSASPKDAGMR